ncbi:MAG TPA: type II secretion system protein GspL [Burkholderiaceae bacterium]|nr:type II secretion system protein GspL [Burkholderiaceae bacterium]
MSLLVIQLVARSHLGPRAGVDEVTLRPPTEYDYVLSRDAGQSVTEGRAAPALLPRADEVVAVVPADDLAWHRIPLPKAPAAKLRAALMGLLEEALLDDAQDVHCAVQPGAQAGEPAWVATLHRGWLKAQLDALEAAGIVVDRIVPQAEPADPPRGHFLHDASSEVQQGLRLLLARPDGVLLLRPSGSLPRAWLPPADAALWTAEPAAAEAAEHWLGQPVRVIGHAQWLLRAAQSPWNLRQFDLALRHRGVRALRDTMRQFAGPAWRPARWGLVALVVVQLVGLNAWAWQQRQAVAERQREQVRLLQTAFPQVRAVLDAPAQMRREMDQLRLQAGKPGDTDLEPMLQAAASAWPPDRRLEGLRFEPGSLTLTAAGWQEEEIEGFRARLAAGGWQVERDGSRLTLRRAALPGGGA